MAFAEPPASKQPASAAGKQPASAAGKQPARAAGKPPRVQGNKGKAEEEKALAMAKEASSLGGAVEGGNADESGADESGADESGEEGDNDESGEEGEADESGKQNSEGAALLDRLRQRAEVQSSESDDDEEA